MQDKIVINDYIENDLLSEENLDKAKFGRCNI